MQQKLLHVWYQVIALLVLVSALLLAGCSEPGGGSNNVLEEASRSLQPADAELAAIYNRSCKSCHTVAATRAPLTGDVVGWAPRMEKGMNTLVDNVVNGYGGMPPFGMCMACDAEQFEALIVFMANGS